MTRRLRCRPGDLALVVAVHGPYLTEAHRLLSRASLGLTVRCLEADACGQWTVEPRAVRAETAEWIWTAELVGAHDSELLPLRDPGLGDAVGTETPAVHWSPAEQ